MDVFGAEGIRFLAMGWGRFWFAVAKVFELFKLVAVEVSN